jgi:uncharacterized damage-inducible protein DinB
VIRTAIASLYDYAEWANQRLLDHAAGLDAADLDRRFSQGCDPIRPAFVHLLSADFRWLLRWQQQPLPPALEPADFPTLDAVRARWATVVADRRAYLAGLSDADLGEILQLQWGPLPRWQAILHCFNHGTQHRSEIAAMLSDLGRSPGDMDYLVFCRLPRQAA